MHDDNWFSRQASPPRRTIRGVSLLRPCAVSVQDAPTALLVDRRSSSPEAAASFAPNADSVDDMSAMRRIAVYRRNKCARSSSVGGEATRSSSVSHREDTTHERSHGSMLSPSRDVDGQIEAISLKNVSKLLSDVCNDADTISISTLLKNLSSSIAAVRKACRNQKRSPTQRTVSDVSPIEAIAAAEGLQVTVPSIPSFPTNDNLESPQSARSVLTPVSARSVTGEAADELLRLERDIHANADRAAQRLIVELKGQVRSLELNVQKLSRSNHQLRILSSISLHAQNTRRLEGIIRERDERIAQLLQLNGKSPARRVLADLEKQNTQWQAEVDELSAQLQAEVDELSAERDSLQQRLEDAGTNADASTTIATLQAELDAAVQERDALQERLETQFSGVNDDAQRTIAQLQAEVDELSAERDSLQQRLEDAGTNADASTTIATLQAELDAAVQERLCSSLTSATESTSAEAPQYSRTALLTRECRPTASLLSAIALTVTQKQRAALSNTVLNEARGFRFADAAGVLRGDLAVSVFLSVFRAADAGRPSIFVSAVQRHVRLLCTGKTITDGMIDSAIAEAVANRWIRAVVPASFSRAPDASPSHSESPPRHQPNQAQTHQHAAPSLVQKACRCLEDAYASGSRFHGLLLSKGEADVEPAMPHISAALQHVRTAISSIGGTVPDAAVCIYDSASSTPQRHRFSNRAQPPRSTPTSQAARSASTASDDRARQADDLDLTESPHDGVSVNLEEI